MKTLAKPLKECWIALSTQIDTLEYINRYQKSLKQDIFVLDQCFNGMATYCKYFPEDLNYIECVKIFVEDHCDKYGQMKRNLPDIDMPQIDKPTDLIEFVKIYCSYQTQQIISDRFQ